MPVVIQKILALLFILFICTKIFAQNFYGFVKRADSTSTSIYQADVVITEEGIPFKTLKTYFDGAFKFSMNKGKSYLIKISYNGYKDTTYTITTNKKGTTSAQNVTIRLSKHGMRLMGAIKNQDEIFPIKDATIVLKNVMTRKEDRQTTSIDGRFNFKLEYETNYRISIDKFSPGIFNKYKDTAFYISTIGFNQPLDYKLDIVLDELLYPAIAARVGYNFSRQATNKVKPIIEITAIKKVPDDSTIVSAATDNAIDLVMKEKSDEDSIALANLNNEMQKLKDDLLTQAKVKQDSLMIAAVEKEKIAKELAFKKAQQDSLNKAIVAAHVKFIQDSVSNDKAEIAARAKAKLDSITRAKFEQQRIVKELALKNVFRDSVNKAAAIAHVKFVEDSTIRAIVCARIKFIRDSVSNSFAESVGKNDSIARIGVK